MRRTQENDQLPRIGTDQYSARIRRARDYRMKQEGCRCLRHPERSVLIGTEQPLITTDHMNLLGYIDSHNDGFIIVFNSCSDLTER